MGLKSFHYRRQIRAFTDLDAITFTHASSFDDAQSHKLHLNNNYIEIYVYIAGNADYIVENRYYSLQQGDILFISPHEVHSAVLKSACQYERFYLLFPSGVFRAFSFDPLALLLQASDGRGALLHLEKNNWLQAYTLLKKMSKLCTQTDGESQDFALFSLLTQFLCILNEARQTQQTAPEHEIPAQLPRLLHDILRYINDNLRQIGSVSELAQTFHVSLPYLSSLFSRHIGVGLSEYLRTQKIALAKQLLEAGESVTYAAYEAGFGDCSYFIKCFKQCVGVTPHKYKTSYEPVDG